MLWVLIRISVAILMSTHNICFYEVILMSMHNICYYEAILMSTHNVRFYGELEKIISILPSNTLIILFYWFCLLMCNWHSWSYNFMFI